MRSLSETFNVNYFLVSQTNPHIVPLMNLKKRVPRKLGNFVETEWKHRCGCCQPGCPNHALHQSHGALLGWRAPPLKRMQLW